MTVNIEGKLTAVHAYQNCYLLKKLIYFVKLGMMAVLLYIILSSFVNFNFSNTGIELVYILKFEGTLGPIQEKTRFIKLFILEDSNKNICFLYA
jgi:hypothetical protein